MNWPLWLKKILVPSRIKYIRRGLGPRRKDPIKVLDIGCGPNARFTKQWFSVTEYHGVDREMWKGFESRYVDYDKFTIMDLEQPQFELIPDNHFDVIILSHVIEHLSNGLEIIELCFSKLRVGGCIYIESPSQRTINFPSANGFLNFYDDATHRRLYFDHEIIQLMQVKGLRVAYTGYRRNWPRAVFTTPVALACNLLYHLPFKHKLCSWGLWETLGVARVWMAVRVK